MLILSATQFDAPLGVGLYNHAQQASIASAGHPGLEVSGNSLACDSVTGSFRIDALSWSPDGGLQEITAAFDQLCDGVSSLELRGCVHYQGL